MHSREDSFVNATPALTGSFRPGIEFSERLLRLLTDRGHRERNVIGVLLLYVAVWTLYGVIAKGGQDIHYDMSEQFALARDLALGYPKHPPLTMLMVRLWFAVFPAADWAYYLLAMANAALALWIGWRLYARYLDPEKRALGLALLTLVPFFNFHALKFNPNTVLMPLWAATTLFFLRSFETRRLLDAALAGLFAAAAMYAKYWSAVLLLGLAIAALIDARRMEYFRSPAPWVTVLVGALAMAPHLIWLVENDFAPFSYAVLVHGEAGLGSSLAGVAGYLAGSVAYVLVPLLVVFAFAPPSREALRDMLWPLDRHRRCALAAFWATLLLPAVIAPAIGVRLTSLWSMSGWTLLPVALLSSPRAGIARKDAARVVAAGALFPLLMLALAPAIGLVVQQTAPAEEGHASVLAEPVDRFWRDSTNAPLKLLGSTDAFSYGIPFYLPEHPAVVHLLERPATPDEEAAVARNGVALVCPVTSPICVNAAKARAAAVSGVRQREVEVRRSWWGWQGNPARYLLIAIPPSAPRV